VCSPGFYMSYLEGCRPCEARYLGSSVASLVVLFLLVTGLCLVYWLFAKAIVRSVESCLGCLYRRCPCRGPREEAVEKDTPDSAEQGGKVEQAAEQKNAESDEEGGEPGHERLQTTFNYIVSVFKVIIVFFQIMTGFASVLNLELPDLYAQAASTLWWINLDVTKVGG
jgi:hypothetical protein